jgi:hypothetical protein
MIALALTALLASMPQKQDLEPPATALTGPSSARLALPVTMRFDVTLTDDITGLIRKDTAKAESSSREPVWSAARFGLSVARRHFEEAGWSETDGERALVIKSVSASWTPGPNYEVKVVVDRYEAGRRVGQATGTGYGRPDRTGQRVGAAFAGPFGGLVHSNANEAKGEEDGLILRAGTVAALDSAFLQLASVWAGEQLMAKARADSEAMMKKAQDDAKAAQKKAKKK